MARFVLVHVCSIYTISHQVSTQIKDINFAINRSVPLTGNEIWWVRDAVASVYVRIIAESR